MVYPSSAQWAQAKHRVREVCQRGTGTHWTDIVSHYLRITGLLAESGLVAGYYSPGGSRKYGILGSETQRVLFRNSNLFMQTHLRTFTEKTLVTLRKQQREKIEEIKKKTNYYTTRNLLDRYDEAASGPGTPPQRRQPIPKTPVQVPQRQPNQKQGQAKTQIAPTPPTLQTPFARAFSSLCLFYA